MFHVKRAKLPTSDLSRIGLKKDRPMPVERQIFREAMSRLGAAVNIITVAGEAGPTGFTASAVCSVTDEPPTLLVCINRNSRSRADITLGVGLCVNTLAAYQKELSAAFAGALEMEERFANGSWTRLVTGAPVLEEAVASFDCRVSNIVEVGTHSVLFCEVEGIRMGDLRDGLAYFARAYHVLARLPDD
jgi:flavin reductase